MRDLWPHQRDAIDKLREAVAQGERRIVCQAPTGSGKTVLAAAIVNGALRKGKRVLFTVPAISLVDQTVESFYSEGFHDIGVIQANHVMTDWSKAVQVASIQTLARRDQVPDADVMVVDECHGLFNWYAKTFTRNEWRNRPIIGLSATPWTRGLGKLYSRLLIVATTAQLIEQGYLCPFTVFAPAHPDLTGVRTVAGDYHADDLAGAMNKQVLVADVIETWIKRGENRSTFCFAVDRAHAQHLQEKFQAAGVACGYIDANTPLQERDRIRDQFHDGRIRVVSSIGCLTMGIDWDVRCIILARPTKSEILYVQMIGRGLRPAEAKDHCLILDHSDTTLRLGFVSDIYHDQLDDGRERAKSNTSSVKLPKQCPQCTYLMAPGIPICPACGFERIKTSAIQVEDGELVEVTGRKRKPGTKRNDGVDPQAFFAQLKGYGLHHEYADGWCLHKFREKFGRWPPRSWNILDPIRPTPEVVNWIRSRNIAFHKARAAHAHVSQ
jgi:superfamily II DNA or RNA helicase